MSDMCNSERYMIYNFPPPEMQEGCEAFITHWEEVMERELINRVGNNEVENRLCYDLSKACRNVDVN